MRCGIKTNKVKLTSKPILINRIKGNCLRLCTDASNMAMAAVILQEFDKEKKLLVYNWMLFENIITLSKEL